MAVVQISKIQLRRGQKNSVSGIPQLASAEMAWAVDSQELYIGNGSVAEGAPYVGNTRILTEHENILGLVSSYRYGSGDDYFDGITVDRPMQQKLDYHVSVADFGGVPGATGLAQIFNTAMWELFAGSDEIAYQKPLYIPNGVYDLDDDLVIPSNAILIGETARGVILNIGEHNVTFVSENGTAFASITGEDFPEHIKISNLTIQRTTGQVDVSGVKRGMFDTVTLLGDYTLEAAIASTIPTLLDDYAPAVFAINYGTSTAATDITFNNCDFIGNVVGVGIRNPIISTTVFDFNNCRFDSDYVGTLLEGQLGQQVLWTYKDCSFKDIYLNAIHVTFGRGTIIRNSKFINCSTMNGTGLEPMVVFGESAGNIVLECSSDRMRTVNLQSSSAVYAVPEVVNADKVTFIDALTADIGLTDAPQTFVVIPAATKTFTIDYVLRLGQHSRRGQLEIAVSNAGLDPQTWDVSITDSYTFSSTLVSMPSGALLRDFDISVSLHDNNTDSSNDTIALSYVNYVEHVDEDSVPIAPGETGTLSFNISYSD